MAVGAITYDTGSPVVSANEWRLTGTIEVNSVYTAFAILPTSNYIKSFTATDTNGAGSVEVDLNVNASGTTTNGTISVAGDHASTDTYKYVCHYV